MGTATSWEELAHEDETSDRWEAWAGLRGSVAQLESRLDTMALHYARATAVLQKAEVRMKRMERRYKPQDPTSPVHVARRYFEKQWKYDTCIAKVRRQMEEV